MKNAALFFCLLCAFLIAQDEEQLPKPTKEDEAYGESRLNEVIVTANRRAESYQKSGSAVSVITREEIDRLGFVSFAELLQTVAGVNFSASGAYGASPSVFVRGLDYKYTLVLLDGVPLINLAANDRVADLSLINTTTIERIELIKGNQSTLWGSAAVGGVIHIITKDPTSGEKAEGSLFLEGGYPEDFVGQVSISKKLGITRLLIAGSHEYHHGLSMAKSSNDSVEFEKDKYRNTSGYGKLMIDPLKSLRIILSGNYSRNELEFDAGAFQDGDNLDEKESWGMSTRVDYTPVDLYSLSLIYSYRGLKWDGTFGNYRATHHYAHAQNDFNWANHSFSFGIDFQWEAVKQLKKSFDADQLSLGLYGLYGLSIGDIFDASLGVRAEWWGDLKDYATYGDSGIFPITYRFTGLFHIDSIHGKVRMSAGSGFRAPSLGEKFGLFGADPNLAAENSYFADASYIQHFPSKKLSFEITPFFNYIENAIAYTSKYENVGNTRSYGVENTLNYQPFSFYQGSINYTYTKAENLTKETDLVRRPEHMVTLSQFFPLLNDYLNIGTSLSWVSSTLSINSSGRKDIADYWKWDANLSSQVTDYLKLHVRFENILNQDYETAKGYTTRPFSVYAGLKLEL